MVDFLFIIKYDDVIAQHNCEVLKSLFELIGRTSSIIYDVKENDITNAKYIILHGTEYTLSIKELILKYKKNIGFTIDESIFNAGNISIEFKKTMQEVDYCFYFNKNLKKELEKYNKNTFLLPLPILWDGLFTKFNIPLPQRNNNGSIRIGLISDLFCIDDINDIISISENNRIDIIYFSDKDIIIKIPPNIKLERHDNITIPMDFYKKLFSLKLNIIYSVLDNNKLQYKNNLKFKESAYMKLPLVVIDSIGIVYPEIINQQNGYSVKTREDARIALKDLISNKDLRIDIGNNANLYYSNKQPITTANLIHDHFTANIEPLKFIDRTISILAIAEGNTPSTELLLINPLTHLKEKGLIKFDLMHVSQIVRNSIKIDYSKYSIVVILRLCSIESYNLFINIPKQQHKHLKFIYMLDDDFSTLETNTAVGAHYKKINTALEMFIKNSDHVIVPSKNLYKKCLNLNSKVFLTKAFHNISEIDSFKKPVIKSDIIIGYAASEHHYENFKILLNPLKQILQKYKNVRFECYFNGNKKGLEGLNIVSYPTMIGLYNFYNHILSRGWDIGLAPLQDNEFNKSKSDNKYREYGAFEIAGIYSNIECYHMIKNNETGILCSNEKEWFNAMEKLILDVDKRKKIIKNAYEDIKKTYDINTITDNYMKIFRGQ